MMDPRKPIHRPDEDTAQQIRAAAYDELRDCTQRGARATGMTGASFVILGTGIWISELAELDQRAARQMLNALCTLYDPNANDRQKAHAERKRRAAVERLLSAVDLDMSQPGGSA